MGKWVRGDRKGDIEEEDGRRDEVLSACKCVCTG